MSSNPLLSRLHTPGATFKLPSGGLFYTNGELSSDVTDGEIHVQPMTAYDELLLKSPDMLFSGQSVEKVFERCIPQILKPLSLLAKDIDYMMACLYHVTYGATLDVTYTHTCENAKPHEYSVDLNHVLKNSKLIDPTTVDTVYHEEMPNGQIVVFEPVRYHTIISFLQKMDQNNNKTPEEEAEGIYDAFIGVIQRVDEVTDKQQIKEWLRHAPGSFIKHIQSVMERIADWGPDFLVVTKCKDCGEEFNLSLPLNPISFFI